MAAYKTVLLLLFAFFLALENSRRHRWFPREMTSEKSILMTRRHHPDLGIASDWLKQILANQRHYPTRHQYGISSLVSQTSFRGETSGGVAAKCRLFSQAIFSLVFLSFFSNFLWFLF